MSRPEGRPFRRFLSPPVPLRENRPDPDRPSLAIRAFVARKAKSLAFRLTVSNRSSPIRSVRRARTVVSKGEPLGEASPATRSRQPDGGGAGLSPANRTTPEDVPDGRDGGRIREVLEGWIELGVKNIFVFGKQGDGVMGCVDKVARFFPRMVGNWGRVIS
jgi:hypothetical protein